MESSLKWLSPSTVDKEAEDCDSVRSSGGFAFFDSVVQESISTSPRRNKKSTKDVSDENSRNELSSILECFSPQRELNDYSLLS